MRRIATVLYRCLVSIIAEIRDEPYSHTFLWLKCRLSLSLLSDADIYSQVVGAPPTDVGGHLRVHGQCSCIRNWTVWHTMRKPYLFNRETQLLEECYSGVAYIARGLYACTGSELMFLYLCTVWIECDHITQTSDCMEYLLALHSQSTLHGVLRLWQLGRQLLYAWYSVES